MRGSRTDRAVSGAHATAVGILAILLPLGAGVLLALTLGQTVHSKLFPWLTSRALGIAAYLSLTALVALGLWMRHPWRYRVRTGHAESFLRAHATLGVATIGLVLAHLVFLATDRFAGVGWSGALVPGLSHYRHVGVSLGVLALYLLVAIGATARFAGRRGTRHWLGVHRLALPTFALAWFHGVLSGADVVALRPLYVVTGGAVAALAFSRLFATGEPPAVPVTAFDDELDDERPDALEAGGHATGAHVPAAEPPYDERADVRAAHAARAARAARVAR